MTDSASTSFDPAEFAALFRSAPGVTESDVLEAAQEANMAALLATQRAAATAYHELFDETLAAQIRALDAATAEMAAMTDPAAAADIAARAWRAAFAESEALAKAALEAQKKAMAALNAEIARNRDKA